MQFASARQSYSVIMLAEFHAMVMLSEERWKVKFVVVADDGQAACLFVLVAYSIITISKTTDHCRMTTSY